MKSKAAVFTFLLIAGFLILVTSQLLDSEEVELSEQCIEEIIADYFDKEAELDLVDMVQIEDDSGRHLKLELPCLNEIGVNLRTWHSLSLGVQDVTLSFRQIDGSRQLQLCSLIESGRTRKMWFYPISQKDGMCKIEMEGSGELILFEEETENSVLLNGEQRSMGFIRPWTAIVSNKNVNEIRILVIIDFDTSFKYAERVAHEIRLEDQDAVIKIMRRGRDGKLGKLLKWPEQVDSLNFEKPRTSLH
jgi:hypothetical protein